MKRVSQWFWKSIAGRYFSLRAKLLLLLFGVVLIFGSVSIWLSYTYVTSTAKSELSAKGSFLVHLLGSRVTMMIMLHDTAAVNTIIRYYAQVDTDIRYIVVYDHNKNMVGISTDDAAIAHSIVPPSARDSLISIHDPERHSAVMQFTWPLMKGRAGYVTIGLDESSAQEKGRRIAMFLIVLISVLTIPAAITVFGLSNLITAPIRQILYGLKVFMPGHPPPKVKIIFNDEIMLLANGIHEMMTRVSQMTEESNKTQLKIIETEKLASVGILASGIAHEINNPIAGIEICAYRLQKSEHLREKDHEYVHLIIEAAQHIQSVVKNLLNYARQPDFKEAALDLRSVVEVAHKLVQFRLKKNNISLAVHCPPAPCTLTAIKAQIIQVMVNGILNAIDAIGHDGTITVTLSDHGHAYTFLIEDTGKGLSSDVKSKAFDPFYTTKGTKGTGLGLYVSYNIIQAHCGHLDLSPRPGGGACLKISLPKGECR